MHHISNSMDASGQQQKYADDGINALFWLHSYPDRTNPRTPRDTTCYSKTISPTGNLCVYPEVAVDAVTCKKTMVRWPTHHYFSNEGSRARLASNSLRVKGFRKTNYIFIFIYIYIHLFIAESRRLSIQHIAVKIQHANTHYTHIYLFSISDIRRIVRHNSKYWMSFKFQKKSMMTQSNPTT